MWQIAGWIGSGLLVAALFQRQLIRLRVLSVLSAVLLVCYNAMLGAWPMVALNACLIAVNAWHLSAGVRHGASDQPEPAEAASRQDLDPTQAA